MFWYDPYLKYVSLSVVLLLFGVPVVPLMQAESDGNTFGISSVPFSEIKAVGLKEPTSIWAVIITVGEVQRDGHGVNRVTDLLLSQGCSEDHMFSLIEEDATKDAILNDSFDWLQTQMIDDDDLVFFYFSMHGNQVEDQQPLDEPDGFDEGLVPFGFDGEPSSYVFDDELAVCFASLNLSRLVLVFETCHSGGMIDGTADLCGDGRVILTSCDVDESSWPMYLLKRWLFPHFFFQGLRGPADLDGDGCITAEESFYYAELRTIRRSSVLAFFFGLIPFIPHDFFPQHPQLFDGWPSVQNNVDEIPLMYLQ